MENLIKGMQKIGDVINSVCRVALGAASILLCLAVIGQLVFRWIGMSISWASEFSCYVFVWTTMLGSAIASRHMLHIGVDMLVNALHGTARKVLLVAADVVLIAALLLFVVSSAGYTMDQVGHMGTTIKVSLAVFYVSLPICGAVMIYYTLVQLLENLYYGEAKRIPLPGDEE